MTLLVGGIPVTLADGLATWTANGLECDADGAWRAYAPDGSGLVSLDALANAGGPGNWYGVVTDEQGTPVVQGKDDPAAGYLVSPTSLGDHNYQPTDPRRYVQADVEPYIVVTRSMLHAGVGLGDLAVVEYQGRRAGAIVADVGPSCAEGSIALHRALGVDPQRARPHHKLVGIDGLVRFAVYLGSATVPAWPRCNVGALALQLAAQRG